MKYEVRRYIRSTVFKTVRGELKLCYCWFYNDKTVFTNKQRALRYFSACNVFACEKAVLRVRKPKRKGV